MWKASSCFGDKQGGTSELPFSITRPQSKSKMKCERCSETKKEFLVKHHIKAGKTIILCGNCHVKEHREHPNMNYKDNVKQEKLLLKGHIIERKVSPLVNVVSDSIEFGYNTKGTLSIVAKGKDKDFLLNINEDRVKKLKEFINRII